MKAKIAAPLPKRAVGINISDEKAKDVVELIVRLGGQYMEAPSDCGEQKIGYVCGMPGYVFNEATSQVESEMLLFSGLDAKALNAIVTRLRERGCIIPLKAIATDKNKDWTVKQLEEELNKEHEYMKNMDKLAKEYTQKFGEQGSEKK